MKTALKVALGIIALAIPYISLIHYQDIHEWAIVWDRVSGDYRIEQKAGFHFSMPWVAAAKIDNRPMRVCITSSSKSFNCKLVQFESGAFKEFVQTEGVRYYWWANRISFNFGYDEEYRGVKDILRGYAFSAKRYPFVRIIKEFEE